ncbi:MAG: single-stranded DNA-binding protein, partial [Lentisphaeria bacterium]|nr:single-stranded DNA-binding protein [Lentisphaeria bacterium]
KQAESCSRFLQKGASVFIEGRLVYDTWTEKDTQKKRSRIRVTAERVQFLSQQQSGRRDDGMDAGMVEEDPTASYDAPRPQSYSRPQPQGQPRYQRQQYDAPQQQPRYQQPRPAQAPMPQPPPMPEGDPLEDVDDIPF